MRMPEVKLTGEIELLMEGSDIRISRNHVNSIQIRKKGEEPFFATRVFVMEGNQIYSNDEQSISAVIIGRDGRIMLVQQGRQTQADGQMLNGLVITGDGPDGELSEEFCLCGVREGKLPKYVDICGIYRIGLID